MKVYQKAIEIDTGNIIRLNAVTTVTDGDSMVLIKYDDDAAEKVGAEYNWVNKAEIKYYE